MFYLVNSMPSHRLWFMPFLSSRVPKTIRILMRLTDMELQARAAGFPVIARADWGLHTKEQGKPCFPGKGVSTYK